jgi:D-alanine-D-alanine ligase
MSALLGKVAVLFGGNSAEREISLRSGTAIAKGLEVGGYDVTLYDTQRLNLNVLLDDKITHVFIALHGRGGEDGCIQGALEYLGLPYTGSGVLGSALSMDKIRSKQIFQAMGLPTASFCIIELSCFSPEIVESTLARLGGKVMVKPANEGSSIGMAMAETPEELSQALVAAFAFDNEILVEAWIDGPEYTIAILGDEALPVIQMETPNAFYDYQAKYQATTTQYHCPCGLPAEDERALGVLALKAFKATGAKGWGRVDVMRNEQNEWQLLEVNTVPGMTETSLVPKAAKAHGVDFSELVATIIEMSGQKGAVANNDNDEG